MEIILTEDVFELGRRGDVIRVAPGYGRNYLIPKKLAVPATRGNRKTFEQQRLAMAKKEAKYKEESELLAGELNQLHLLVSRKSGESGTLFGSVTAKDIVDLLKKKGINVDRRKVMIDQPIKSIGNFKVQVRPHSDVHAQLLVSVLIEGDEPVFSIKTKDAESDRIVSELNAKVREITTKSVEDRIVTDRFGPEEEPAGEETASEPESSLEEPAEAGALEAAPEDDDAQSPGADETESQSEEASGPEAEVGAADEEAKP